MSHTNILEDYTMGKVLGTGSFAVVYKAEHKPTKKVVAIKSIKPKLILNSNTMHYVETEIEIMRTICHPHLLNCNDYIKSEAYVYLIMDYCSMGDLNGYIKHTHKGQGLPEDTILHFLDQLASGLKYLHDQNLIHRDIKPKNIFLVPPSATSASKVPDVKLGDFGFAKMLPKTSLAMSVLGSPIYMAPEVLKGEPYNYKADLWSLGVVLYELMTGHTLFRSKNMENLRTTVDEYKDHIQFGNERYKYSTELIDLVRVLLKRHPRERASCEEFCHYIKLIAQKNQCINEFSIIEDDYIVIECDSTLTSSIIAPTPPLIPNIQRSHSVDYYQKRPAQHVRDRRHSAGSKGTMLTKAISMSPFNLFGTHRSNSEKALGPSSSSSSAIVEESIAEEEDVVKCYKDKINYCTGLDLRLFEITGSLIRLFDTLLQPSKISSFKRTADDESIALIRKIVFVLNLATTIDNKLKFSLEENGLLLWGKAKLAEFMPKQSSYKKIEIDQRVVQRLLYDNAVEMSREAAVSQLVGEDLFNCKTKYEESILLLEAVLIIPTNEYVKTKDIVIIENLIQSLKNRIKKISPEVLTLHKEIETLKL
ncbi:kinase-like domain-containing protein [Parasitella parasitica]|nr:kinase-like domain-containing protein [Parasitella parasitica]